MPNPLERFFEDACARISEQRPISENGLPRPEYPMHDRFNPDEGDGDEVIPVRERHRLEDGPDAPQQLPIGKGEQELLDSSIREVGFDVFAFYKSRRYLSDQPYRGKWGIFYLEHGIERVRQLIEATHPGYGPSRMLAYEFLRAHERFHLKFDLYALSVEATMGRMLYEPLNRAFRDHSIYQVEEALANRDTWEWAKSKRIGLGEFAKDFMKCQPGAYARFEEDRLALCSELAANLLDLDVSRGARRDDQRLWVGKVPEELLLRSLCPEYVVRPARLTTWIKELWKLPTVSSVTESPTFLKLLASKYASLRDRWERTKEKLIANPGLRSLDFKLWDKSADYWSVRINDNFRAHLRQIDARQGTWEAHEFGTHTAMGHG